MKDTYFLRKTIIAVAAITIFVTQSFGQQKLVLTFDQAVQIAFDKSYEVNKRRLEYQRGALNNRAGRAALKSSSDFSVELPSMNQSIVRLYNSSTRTYSTIESERTQIKLNWNITKKIITNGQFSFRSNLESLDQKGKERSYKNKLFLEFKQPLLTRNTQRKSIERSDYSFERTELNSLGGILTHYQSLNRLYYDLYRSTKEYEIDTQIVDINLIAFQEAQQQFKEGRIDTSEVVRLEVDYLLNKNSLLSKKVALYKKELEFKQKFGLSFDQPVELIADLKIAPLDIDMDLALERGLTDRPSIRSSEIGVILKMEDRDRAKSTNTFKGDLVATYGFENSTNPTRGEKFNDMFHEYNVTRSLKLTLSFPLWDSGRQRYNVEAAELEYQSEILRFENSLLTRENAVRSAVRNAMSSQRRALTQQTNIESAKQVYDQSLEKFKNNEISSQELSRALEEYRNAQTLYLGAFISYQTSWINLAKETYWDWDKNESLKERFRQYLLSY